MENPKVLYEAQIPSQSIADIVFVHGLGGHLRRTWTRESATPAPVQSTTPLPIQSTKPIGAGKKRGILGFLLKFFGRNGNSGNPTQSGKQTEWHAVCWPEQLLPQDCPESRILAWGYDSDVSKFFEGSASKNTIFAHSRALIADLKSARKSCPERPLIFVAHSLGGIIVKQMLLASNDSDDEDDTPLCQSTREVLFLGTPHRGSDYVNAGEILRSIASAAGFDTAKQNLRDLAIDSGILQECHTRFQRLQSSKGIRIRTFQEGLGFSGTSYFRLNQKVVPDVSSTYDGRENPVTIPANHINMCKFESRSAEGYHRVVYALTNRLEKLASEQKRIKTEEAAANDNFMAEKNKTDQGSSSQLRSLNVLQYALTAHLACLQSLTYPDMHNRHQDIHKAHPNSGVWVFKHDSYVQWMNQDRGLLWIKGKPGCGKSTLMKKILKSSQEESTPKLVLLSFFFHRRGQPLQYSEFGMLRTMMYQLLSQVPLVRANLKRMWEEKMRLQRNNNPYVDWRLEELREVFSSSLLEAGKTTTLKILVDALDEAGEGPARNMVSSFHGLRDEIQMTGASVKICFSCRKYPQFPSEEDFEICVDGENHKDIEEYISVELKRQLLQRKANEDLASRMRAKIAKKASGVFLWVFLMIPIIAKQYNDGESPEHINQKLSKVPSNLDYVYRHILTEVVDPEKRSRTLLLMQWIFLARRPLSVTELRIAMVLNDTVVRPSQYSIDDLRASIDNDAQMEKLIISLSGGLAEVKEHDQGIQSIGLVQFIHESVNDFLRKDGFKCLEASGDPVGDGHYRLCASCVNYLKLEEVLAFEMLRPPDNTGDTEILQFSKYRERVQECFPFMSYATLNWPYHAKEAETRSTDLHELLNLFGWPSKSVVKRWKYFRLLLHVTHGVSSDFVNAEGPGLLHVTALFNLTTAFRALLAKNDDIEGSDGEGHTAIHYAAANATGNQEIMSLLIQYKADMNARSKATCTALHVATAQKNNEIVQLLVYNGAHLDIVSRSHFSGPVLIAETKLEVTSSHIHGTALHIAAFEGDEQLVHFFIARGADVNASKLDGVSILHDGIFRGHDHIVRLLIDSGANVNSRSKRCSALEFAIRNRKESMVKILLGCGADVNPHGKYYGTALQEAVHSGSSTVVRMLLEKGVNFDERSRSRHWSLSAFKLAKQLRYKERKAIVELLMHWKYGKKWLQRTRRHAGARPLKVQRCQ